MVSSISPETVYVVSDKVVPRRIKDKLIIVPIEDGVANFSDAMFSFNDTGARIWECIEQQQNVQTICSTLAQEYNAEIKKINRGVENLIGTLVEKGIVKEWKT
jgi:hypothetical protein